MKKVVVFFILFWVFSSIGLAQDNSEIVPIATDLPDENPTEIANILPEHHQFASPEAVSAKIIDIPIEVKGSWGSKEKLNLKATLFMPEGEGPFPLMVFSHGGVRSSSDRMQVPSFDLTSQFTKRGIAVIAPIRRGRGGSDGDLYDTQRECSESNKGLKNSLEDTDGVIKYMKYFPRIDFSELIFAGHSRGGVLSVALAEKYPQNAMAAINFSGGWWDKIADANGSKCSSFNNAVFKRSKKGKFTKETLWVYGKWDQIVTQKMGEKYHKTYTKRGGDAKLHIDPNGGHRLHNNAAIMSGPVSEYLESIGYYVANTGLEAK